MPLYVVAAGVGLSLLLCFVMVYREADVSLASTRASP